MKIFVDTANLKDIEEALKRGFIDGVTTNPSLLAKEPKTKFEKHIGKIVKLLKKYKGGEHLSVEVFSQDPEEILKQAKYFVETFKYDSLSIKVQVGWNELEVINKLAKEGISVNCTACMTVMQGIMAAHAGAKYISFFWGRIRDSGTDIILEKMKYPKSKDKDAQTKLEFHLECLEKALEERALDRNDADPYWTVQETRRLLDESRLDTEIIAGSMRGVVDIRDSLLAGAHIVTVPPKFFPAMVKHFKTEEVVQQFFADFEKWLR